MSPASRSHRDERLFQAAFSYWDTSVFKCVPPLLLGLFSVGETMPFCISLVSLAVVIAANAIWVTPRPMKTGPRQAAAGTLGSARAASVVPAPARRAGWPAAGPAPAAAGPPPARRRAPASGESSFRSTRDAQPLPPHTWQPRDRRPPPPFAARQGRLGRAPVRQDKTRRYPHNGLGIAARTTSLGPERWA